MKGIWRKLTSLFLALILTLQMLPVQALAAEANSIPGEKAGLALVDTRLAESESVEGAEIAKPSEVEEPQIVAEIPEGRDEFQKEFRLSNGMNMISIYGSAVHYEEDGEWKEIDNTLQPVSATGEVLSGKLALKSAAAYTNTAGMWGVKLPATLSSSTPIEVSRDGYTLAFQFAGEIHNNHLVMSVDDGNEATHFSVQPTENRSLEFEGAFESAEVLTSINSATASVVDVPVVLTDAPVQAQTNKLYSAIEYSSIYSNTDLRYDLQSNRLKESVIIKSAKDTLAGYRYTISAPGMILELQDDNSIHVYAADAEAGAEPLFYMPAPFLVDDNWAYNDNISINLQKNGDSYTLTYSLPRTWLMEEERAYPVVLDPVIMPESGIYTISDQTVFSAGSMSYTWACVAVGHSVNLGKARTLIKFRNLPNLTSADVIVGASLSLCLIEYDTAITMEAHQVLREWESHTVTWGDMDTGGSPSNPASEWNSVVEDYQIITNPTWYAWDITNIAQKWYSDGYNSGVLFKASDAYENISAHETREFYSSDWGGSVTPVLSITYLNNSGLEDYWDYTSQSVGRAGTGYVNNFTGNLVWIHSGLGFSGNRMPVSISHVYNANDKSNNDSGLGYGWRTNYNQQVYQWTSPGDNPTAYCVWIDQDGTRRYFYKDSGSTYINETDSTLKLTVGGSGDRWYCIEDKNGNKSYFDTQGRLREICNNQAEVSSISIAYDGDSNRITKITDGAGRVYAFSYENSLLSSISFKGTGDTALSTLNYGYDNNSNLVSISYPDGNSVTYGYTDNHLLTSATDVGGYAVTYSYNTTSAEKPNRVISVAEYDGSAAGGTLDIEYAHNQTTFVDHNGNKEIVQFNNYGSTVSVQDGLGRAQFAQYAGQGSPKSASQLTLSSKLQNTVVNILRNGGFEWWDYWSSASGNVSTGSWDYTSEHVYRELYSLKISRTADGGQYTVNSNADSACVVEAGKSYVLSAYVKTTGMNGGGNGAKIALKLTGSGVVAVSSEAIKVNGDWTRLTATYTHPANAASEQAVVQLSNESSGTAYFDAIMLERAVTVSRHNLVENGDFGRQDTTTTDAFSWHEGGSSGSTEKREMYSGESAAPQLDNYVFTMTGDPYLQKNYYQTVLIAGQAGDVYSVSGWGKGDTVPLTDGTNRRFGIFCRFFYTDGSTGDTMINFNPDTDSSNNWQFVASRVVAKQNYTSLRIFLVCDYNMNTVYFDGIQVFKEEFGQSYDYDETTGLVTSVIDLQQKETKYEYQNNQLTAIIEQGTSPKTIAEYEYDDYNNVTKAIAEDGTITYFAYDTYGNNTAVAVSDSNTQLDLSATNVTVKSGGPVIASFAEYTPDGNYLKNVTDALGNVTKYTYNSQTGVLLSVVSPYSANEQEVDYTTTYDHDTLFRTTSVENGSADVSYGYGCLHICTESCTDPCSHICSDTCDPDGADLLRAIVSASETQYTFTYGIFDLLQSVKIGARTLISHQYSNDANRYLTQSTYGNGDTITYAYDAYGRTTSKTYEDKASVTYAYDNNGNLGLVTDSATGRTTKYLYDLQDRLSRYEELGTGYSSTVEWSYNAENELTSQKHILNGTEYITNYSYDDDHQLTKIQQGNIVGQYTYDKFGRMTSVVSKNGDTPVVSTTIGFTNPSNTTTSSQVASWANSVGGSYTYKYDVRGNITKIYANGTLVAEYTYDDLDQLLIEKNHLADTRWEYTYDDGGNIKSKTEVSPVTATSGTTIYYHHTDTAWKDLLTSYGNHPLPDEGSTALDYDEIGNLRDDGTWSYTWQHGRQLVGMSKSGTTISYAYNADGLRISKNVNGTIYNYHYLGDQLVEMTWGSNKMSFVYDVIGPAAVIYNGTTYYYTRNAQGDVTGIVNASGTQVVAYNYDAWGNLLSTTGSMAATLGAVNPLRYRGYVYDTETGLYYLQSRYYNPSWGRFINADGYITAGESLLSNNQFAYCGNNPINRKDDNGRWFTVVIGAVVGACVNAAVSYISGDSWQEILISAACGAVAGALAATGVGGILGQAAIGAATSLIDSGYKNYNDVVSGEKTIGQAIISTVVDTGTGAALGAGGFSGKDALEISNKMAQNAFSALKKLSTKALHPTVKSAAVSTLKQTGKYLWKEFSSAFVDGVGSGIFSFGIGKIPDYYY